MIKKDWDESKAVIKRLMYTAGDNVNMLKIIIKTLVDEIEQQDKIVDELDRLIKTIIERLKKDVKCR